MSESFGPAIAIDADAPASVSARSVVIRWLVGIALVAGFFTGMTILNNRDLWFIDLRVYVMGGKDSFSDHLYDAISRSGNLPFTYPPFAALIFTPFRAFPLALMAYLFTALSMGAWWLTTRTLLHRLGISFTNDLTLIAVCALGAFGFEPVATTLKFGQINLLIMALVALDILIPDDRRPMWLPRGIGVGLATGVKLTPGLFIVFFMLTRQWRMAIISFMTFSATVVVGFVMNASAASYFWTNALFDTSRVGNTERTANQSITGVIDRIAHQQVTGGWVLVAQVVIVAVALILAVVAYRLGYAIESMLTVGLATSAASPIAWSHHWVWAWLAVLTLIVRWWQHRELPTLAITIAWVLIFTSRTMWRRGMGKPLEWSVANNLIGNLYIVAFVAWVAWLFWQIDRGYMRDRISH